MVHAFFDDGKSFGKKGIICLAGYVSDDPGWDRFTQEWIVLLKKHEMRRLHTSDFLSGEAEYRLLGWPYPKRVEVLQDFIGAIRKHVLFGAGIAIDGDSYDDLFRHQRKKPKAEGVCFFRLMRRIVERARSWPEKFPISLVFDDSEHSSRFLGHYHELKRERREFRELVTGIAFADDTFVTALQAADLLACATVQEHRKDQKWADESPFHDLLLASDPAYGIHYESEFLDREMLERLSAEILPITKNLP